MLYKFGLRYMSECKTKSRSRCELIELISACIDKTCGDKYAGGFKGYLITKWDGDEYRQFDRNASNVIIIEHRLPYINGIEATRNILAKYPKMRIAIVSSDEALENDAHEAGAIRFIKNPISFLELQKIIDELSCEKIAV